MFLTFVRGITTCLILALFGSCATLSPSPERKWVPHPFRGTTLVPGVPAFILVLETRETACARQENRAECYRDWEELPTGFQGRSEDEVSYLHDYGDGFQQVRLGLLSYCVIVADLIDEEHSCQDLWRAFSRKKLRENV